MSEPDVVAKPFVCRTCAEEFGTAEAADRHSQERRHSIPSELMAEALDERIRRLWKSGGQAVTEWEEHPFGCELRPLIYAALVRVVRRDAETAYTAPRLRSWNRGA